MALTIWWCEGSKKRRDKRWKNAYLYPIEVINSDPRILDIFLEYLRNVIGIDEKKLRGQIQIHEGDNKLKIETFWSQKLGIPRGQFNKTIIRAKGRQIKKPNKYGTFKIRYYDKRIFLRLEEYLGKCIAECSAVGSAPRLGRGGPRFESGHSDTSELRL